MSKERATDPHVLHPKFFRFTYLKFLLFLVPFSQGTDDTLTMTTLISDDDLGGDILVSAGRKFELGFFSPGTSSNRYLGIWYHDDPLTIVWVANRERPLSKRSGVFRLEVNGNLGLSMDGESYWSTNLPVKASSNRTAKLMDSGNLVLSETGGLKIWWSFDHPTDTFLPGMFMGEDLKLTSWRGPDEPAPGDFTFQRDPEQDNQYMIEKKYSPYWESGVSGKIIPDDLPPEISSLLTNSSSNLTSNARLVMNFNGTIRYFTSSSGTKLWNRSWFEPRDQCHQYNFCGNFGVCNSQKKPLCRCLPGFAPQQSESWGQGDFSQGCARTSPLCGEMNSTAFETIQLIKIEPTKVQNEFTDQTQCKEECLADCNCQAYSYTYNRSAATGKCRIWSQDLIRFIQEGNNNSHDVYIRKSLSIQPSFPPSEGPKGDIGSLPKGKPRHLIYLLAAGALALVIAVVALLYMWRKSVRRQAKRGAIAKNLEFQLYDSERRIKEWTSSGQFAGNDEEGIKVPFFDIEVVLEATNYFSDENKLGQGGFGPVYKGKFPGGQEIAVKRLSSGSGQGFEEFKNEVLLIAQLQHRNLVKLLGYCTRGEEKLLIYEYMPNKSLDSFIFDRTRCVLLNWETRMEIISGIARGMLYLHQDSRLTVIHRDLKASNILLDEELNPKISDFGLARIFEAKQTGANTNRVIGTYGYMSPEYALDGFFSTKSDVFSFGVVVLEIISGKRNTGFYQSKVALNLLSYAWRLWNEDNAIDLVDPILHRTCNTDEALKCIKLALLCVQSDPSERPTMSNIVFTLSHEIVTLPTPRKPAFAVEKGFSCEASSSSGPESYIEISNSLEQGR